MKVYSYPDRKLWEQLVQRPAMETVTLEKEVSEILRQVKANGDEAVKGYTLQFDRIQVDVLKVGELEFQEGMLQVDDSLKTAILRARQNIELFHSAQREQSEVIETMPGIQCWRRSVPIGKVGLYIPGGTAPLFSTVLMLGIPAKLAGCEQIVLCTPPGADGKVNPAVLFAAGLAGISEVYKVGGVQAIAAMAYGTQSIPRVYKIFGPGNQYVTCAKQLIMRDGVAIDLPAGPSEVAILADATANANYVAADLLSQAEHGVDSQVLLVTDQPALITEVQEALSLQLSALPRKVLAEKALENSKIVLMKNMEEGLDLLNNYAPEHLILACQHADEMADRVVNAGSVFLGHYSPESVGDYASGTNHTLPTNGYARAYSGVSLDSFIKKITFQKLSPEGLHLIADTVEQMAEAEGLQAHRRAVSIRKSPKR